MISGEITSQIDRFWDALLSGGISNPLEMIEQITYLLVDALDGVPMADRDTKGDLYEYMLGKIASAAQNGQFRTPRHLHRRREM